MDTRHEIDDRAWALIEPLLPVSTGKRGGRYRDHRTVVEAIVWKYRTGAPWRDLPERFGPWQTAWKRHATWSRSGVWDRVWRALQSGADAQGELDWLVAIDSSIARVHQHAATLPREPSRGAMPNHTFPAIEPPDRAIGRSRGGLTTKIHMACDGAGLPLSLWLTGGNVNDSTELGAVMAGIRVAREGPGRPRTRPDRLIADKGYSSRANRRLLADRSIKITIPEKDDQLGHRRRRGAKGGRPYAFDPDIYRRRNVVERGFNRFKHWRGLASRYDKTATCYLGALTLASLLLWAEA